MVRVDIFPEVKMQVEKFSRKMPVITGDEKGKPKLRKRGRRGIEFEKTKRFYIDSARNLSNETQVSLFFV